MDLTVEHASPIAELTKNPFVGDSPMPITVPAELRTLSDSSDWIRNYPEKMPFAEYMDRLSTDRTTLAELVDAMEKLLRDLDRWPATIRDHDKNDATFVFDIVHRNQNVIQSHIFGKVRRHQFRFAERERVREGLPLFVISKDSDGDYHVGSGSRNIAVIWSLENRRSLGVCKKELDECAGVVANAVAYCDPSDLNELRHAFDDVPEAVRVLKTISTLVQDEILRFSRWTVRALVTNDGEEPVALGTSGVLYVNTRGHQIAEGGVARGMLLDARIDVVLAEPVTITVEGIAVPAGYRERMEPVILEGGKAATIVLQSKSLLDKSHDDWQGLYRAFGEGTVRCALVLGLVGGGSDGRNVESSDVPFQESGARRGFADAEQFWRAR